MKENRYLVVWLTVLTGLLVVNQLTADKKGGNPGIQPANAQTTSYSLSVLNRELLNISITKTLDDNHE